MWSAGQPRRSGSTATGRVSPGSSSRQPPRRASSRVSDAVARTAASSSSSCRRCAHRARSRGGPRHRRAAGARPGPALGQRLPVDAGSRRARPVGPQPVDVDGRQRLVGGAGVGHRRRRRAGGAQAPATGSVRGSTSRSCTGTAPAGGPRSASPRGLRCDQASAARTSAGGRAARSGTAHADLRPPRASSISEIGAARSSRTGGRGQWISWDLGRRAARASRAARQRIDSTGSVLDDLVDVAIRRCHRRPRSQRQNAPRPGVSTPTSKKQTPGNEQRRRVEHECGERQQRSPNRHHDRSARVITWPSPLAISLQRANSRATASAMTSARGHTGRLGREHQPVGEHRTASA